MNHGPKFCPRRARIKRQGKGQGFGGDLGQVDHLGQGFNLVVLGHLDFVTLRHLEAGHKAAADRLIHPRGHRDKGHHARLVGLGLQAGGQHHLVPADGRDLAPQMHAAQRQKAKAGRKACPFGRIGRIVEPGRLARTKATGAKPGRARGWGGVGHQRAFPR